MKTTYTLIALALCFCFIGAIHGSISIPVELTTTEQTTTAREEIVTGLCTFGDCPVATTEPETEPPTTEPATEASTQAVRYTEPATEYHASERGGFIGRMYITGYTAEEGFPLYSATASGYGVRPGYCALNNSQRQALGIRYGDQIYVEGLGTYTVMDCGCDWGVVDIWVYTNAEAYAMTGYYEVYYG